MQYKEPRFLNVSGAHPWSRFIAYPPEEAQSNYDCGIGGGGGRKNSYATDYSKSMVNKT